MLKFGAEIFYKIGRNIARLTSLFEFGKPDDVPDAELIDIMIEGTAAIQAECLDIGLRY